ncbi:MAG: class I SAM-dependent methyltransferase [Thermodesulfobacteriota bacterium]
MVNGNYTFMVSRLREQIKKDSSIKEFSRVYDEYNKFLQKYCPNNANGHTFLYRSNVRSNPVKRFVLRYVLQDKNVLELGIGDGTVSGTLAHKANHVVGVDVSQFIVKSAKERYKGIEAFGIRWMDARHLDLSPDFFDYVIGLDLVEHLPFEDIHLHIMEVNKVLKNGGIYLIWTVLKCMNEKEEDLHLKVYSLKELAGLLEQSGFEVTLYDVRFILFNKIVRIPRVLNRAIFFYEKLLHTTNLAKLFKKVDYLKWLIMPPCIIEARKVK